MNSQPVPNGQEESGGPELGPVVPDEPFYSLARRSGNTLYLSGAGPIRDGRIVRGTIAEQTRATMDALGAVLEANSLTFEDVVRVNVFLLNMSDRDSFNDAYMEYFSGQQMPTRRLIGAGDLYEGILVEIDCIAHFPS
jgi:2-iminobutanoate/2-iminopropanoate deaminase